MTADKNTIIILSHVQFDDSPYCVFVHEHAKTLVRQGYNVYVIATLTTVPFINLFKKNRKKYYEIMKGQKNIDGVNVIYTKRLGFSNFLYNSKINFNGISYYYAVKNKVKEINKKEKVLYLDGHTFKIEGYAVGKLKKKYSIPATVTCHGTSFFRTIKSKNADYYVNKICSNVDYVICVSEDIKRKAEKFGVKNVIVIYNGINYYKDTIDYDNYNYNITSIGTLIERKNFDIVIKAFVEIRKAFKNVHLTIVGSGNKKEELLELTKLLKVEKYITFVGNIPNYEVYNILRKSHIFVLPSVREGFGIVYPEAMYNGCITIGTKNEGIDGLIVDNKNGYLVEPNVENVKNKIINIFSNREYNQKIRRNGIETAKMLNWERNVEEYIKLFY